MTYTVPLRDVLFIMHADRILNTIARGRRTSASITRRESGANFGSYPLMEEEQGDRRRRRQRTTQDIDAAKDPDAHLTIATVSTMTGMGRSTIRAHVRDGTFPQPIRIAYNVLRWRAGAIRDYLRGKEKTAPKGR